MLSYVRNPFWKKFDRSRMPFCAKKLCLTGDTNSIPHSIHIFMQKIPRYDKTYVIIGEIIKNGRI